MPTTSHASRDLKNFRKQTGEGKKLSKRLQNMYAKELFLAGETEDLTLAKAYFMEAAADPDRDTEEVMEACLVVARAARLLGEEITFFKYANKVLVSGGNSEICMEMGLFYEEHGDLEESVIWYYNAVYETQPILSLESGRRHRIEGLIRCYEKLGMAEQVQMYREELEAI
jgi:hypothetical protein